MLFDPNESIDFNGHTGPFIQYTHARIKSIVRKNQDILESFSIDSESLLEVDLQVIKALSLYPEIIEEAGLNKSPALIANYLYELVKEFNHFYQNSPSILKEENQDIKSFRVNLCKSTGSVIKSGMSLLGIQVPERM